jgi:protease-4
VVAATPPQRPSFLRRAVRGLFIGVLLLSLLLNVYLLAAIVAATGSDLQQTVLREGEDEQIVAVWTVSGAITGESVESFRRFYRTVNRTPDIKAVVLRVDSPGGGVAASDEIYAMVKDIQARMPVVVTMGGLAASGGYYISAPASEIFAEPGTATGSIGVIAQIPNFSGTAEKIGLEMEVVKSSHAEHWKDMLSPFRDMRPRERQRLIEILDAMQQRFETVVRDGRGDRLRPEENVVEVTLESGETVERPQTEPFNGMVYTADEALALGLVDRIGYEADAMNRAAELANLSNPQFIQYHVQPGLLWMVLFGADAPDGLGAQADLIAELRTPQFLYFCTLK